MQIDRIPFNTGINPISQFTEIKPSSIHKLGIFARKSISQGTIWWYARKEDVTLFTQNQISLLLQSNHNESISAFIKVLLTYAYYEANEDCLVFCLDNSRYTNHSLTPNSGGSHDYRDGFCSIALRDIEIGEEITENYFTYQPCLWLKEIKDSYPIVCW